MAAEFDRCGTGVEGVGCEALWSGLGSQYVREAWGLGFELSVPGWIVRWTACGGVDHEIAVWADVVVGCGFIRRHAEKYACNTSLGTVFRKARVS